MSVAEINTVLRRNKAEPELGKFLHEQARPFRTFYNRLGLLAFLVMACSAPNDDKLAAEGAIGALYVGVSVLEVYREERLTRYYDRRQPIPFEEPVEEWANSSLTAHWEAAKAMLSGDHQHPHLGRWASSELVGHWATAEAMLAEAS